MRAVYEAGPTGFALARGAEERGLEVRIVAPGSIMNRPKTALQSYRICIPEIARAITSCWISAVPSKMS